MNRTLKEWRKLAAARTRVICGEKSGNLSNVTRETAIVFIGYSQVGACRMPEFERWPLADVRLEVEAQS